MPKVFFFTYHYHVEGCSTLWKEIDHRIATLEFDRDRKSMGVVVNTGSGKNSLYVKVHCFVCRSFPFFFSWKLKKKDAVIVSDGRDWIMYLLCT